MREDTVYREKVLDICNVDYAAYDGVWMIMCLLKYPGKMEYVSEIVSFLETIQAVLLDLWNTGRWNAKAFQGIYIPTFLRKIQTVTKQEGVQRDCLAHRFERSNAPSVIEICLWRMYGLLWCGLLFLYVVPYLTIGSLND